MDFLRRLFGGSCSHDLMRLTQDDRGYFTRCWICGHTRPVLGQETK